MLSVTKKFGFCYGHNLPDYEGKCRINHGHNSEVEVEFADIGQPAYPGMIIDFNDIKSVVGPIIEELDHKTLNNAMPQEYQPPTAENICKYLVEQIQLTPIGEGLVRVRITETPTSWAEWKEYV